MVVVLAFGAAIAVVAARPARLRLDLRGGIQVVLEAKDSPTRTADSDAVDRALEVLRRRVDQLGVSEPILQRSGERRIIVELPGVVDPDQAVRVVGQKVRDEFIGATVSSELLWPALIALALALGAQLAYLAIRFRWTYGSSAVAAMFHDVPNLLGVFAWLGREIDGVFVASDFPLALLVGIVVSTYSSIFTAAPLAVTLDGFPPRATPTQPPRTRPDPREVAREGCGPFLTGRPRSARVARQATEPEEEAGATKMSAGPWVGVKAKTLLSVVAAGSALLLLATACGAEPGAPSRSPTPDTASATRSPAVTSSSHSPSGGPRYPNLRKFSDPFDRFAYKAAYSDCRFVGIDGTAAGFGGVPDDPPSVARAYAAAIFPDSVEHRNATFQGCLDGFKAATP